MITILNEMEYVVAVLANDESDALPFTDDRIHEKLNDAYLTLTFRTHGRRADGTAHPDAAQLVADNKVVYPDKNGDLQMFIIRTVEEVEELDGTYVKEIYAEHTSLELNGVVIRPQTFTGVTARQYMEHIISGTRWEIGVVEWFGSQTITLDDYTAGIQAIITGAEMFEGEFKFRAKMEGGKLTGLYVDLVERRGIETGILIESGHNLKSVKRIEDGSQIYTALIGLARGQSGDDGYKTFTSISAPDKPAGQDWIGANDALQKHGILLSNGERQHYFGVYLYEGNENLSAARLLELTRKKLREVSVPKFTYETTFQDLSQITGYEATKFNIGDTIAVNNPDFSPPLLVSARIIEAEYGSNPEDSSVVLGDYRDIWRESQVSQLAALRSTILKSAAEWEAGIGQDEADSSARAAAARVSLEDSSARKSAYEQQAARVIASDRLEDETIRDRITAAQTNYDSMYADYASRINEAVADNSVSQEEQAAISAAWNRLSAAEKELSSALQAAEANILKNAEEAAAEAGAAAGEAAAENTVTLYAEKKIFRGPDIPENPVLYDLWVDMTEPTRPIWKQFDGQNWVNLTRTNISEMLGELSSAQLANNAVTAAKIVDGAISDVKIATAAVTGLKIADNAVAAEKIVNGAVGSLKLADAAVTSLKIADNAVEAAKIVNGAIEAAKLAANAVTETKIATGAVIADKIAANAVTNAKIVDGAISDVKIATGAVTGLKIADNAVAAEKIVNGAVDSLKLADAAVTGLKIADNAVAAAKIVNGAIEAAKIATNAVTETKIAAGAVIADKIAANAVTNTKIINGAINDLKIASLAVTEAKIAASAVSEGKIATGAVVADKIAANAIVAAKIAAGAIESDKIAANAVVAGKIAAGSISTSHIVSAGIDAGVITAGKIRSDVVQIGNATTFENGYDPTKIEIGGRNLLINTDFHHEPEVWSDTTVEIAPGNPKSLIVSKGAVNTNFGFVTDRKTDLENGQKYTLSFELKTTDVTSLNYSYVMDNDEGNTSIRPTAIINDGQWHTYKEVYTLTFSKKSCGVMLGTSTGTQFEIRRIKLEKGDKATDWTPAPEDQQAYVDAVEIGGRNLALDSHFYSGSTNGWYAPYGPLSVENHVLIKTLDSTFSTSASRQQRTFTLEKGIYTFTFSAKTTKGFEFRGFVNANILQADNASASETFQKYSVTFDVPADGAVTLRMYMKNAAEGDVFEIDWYKLERGVKATDWTPAPEDTSAEITAAVTPANERIQLWQHEDTVYIAGGSIFANSVTANEIAAGAVATDELAANAVVAGKIAAGAIETDKLAANAVTAAKIAADTITAAQIAANAITATEIATNAVTAIKINAGAVEANKIAANAIIAEKIAAGAVETDKIAANAIVAGKIAAGSISTSHIVSTGIDAGVITAGRIAADHVQIGSGTDFADGFDPTTKETPEGAQLKADTAEKNAIITDRLPQLAAGISRMENKTSLRFNGAVGAGKVSLPETLRETMAVMPSATLEAWIKLDKDVVSTSDGGLWTFTGQRDTNGNLYPYASDYRMYLNTFLPTRVGPVYYTGKTLKEWHLLSISFDATKGEWNLYLNGELLRQYNRAAAEFISVDYDELAFGINNGNRFLLGRFGEIRIWKKALTQKEVIENANNTFIQKHPDILAYYPMSEGEGTTVNDVVSGYDGIISGTYEWYKEFRQEITAAVAPANERLKLWQHEDTVYISGGAIFANSVTSNEIAAGAIATDELAANAVVAGKIAAGAIETDKLAANAVTAAKIAAGTITAAEIATGAITSDEIAAKSILAAHIAVGAVEANNIAALAITSEKILAGAVTAEHIKALTITGAEIAANAITAGKIDAGAVNTDKLAANSVNAGKIAAGAITTSHIAAAGIDAGVLTAGSVIASDIIFSGKLSGATGTFKGSLEVGSIGTTFAEIKDGRISARKTLNSITTEALLAGGALTLSNNGKTSTIVQSDTALYITPPAGGWVSMASAELTVSTLTAYGAIDVGDITSSGTMIGDIIAASSLITTNGPITAKSNVNVSGRLSGSTSSADVEVSGTYTALAESGICGIGGMQNGTSYSGAMSGVYVQFRHRKSYTPSSISISGRSSNLDSSTNIATTDITNYGFWLYLNHTSGRNTFKYWRGSYYA